MKVLIFTEGGRTGGLGHISRCLALYQAFACRKHEPWLIINADNSVKSILKQERYKILNWVKNYKKLTPLLKDAGIAVIDSYLSGPKVYKFISEKSALSVYIDDYKRIKYPKGIIINSAVSPDKLRYPKEAGLTYLLGTKYAFLRKEFWDIPGKLKVKKDIKTILITFGGADPVNMTPRVLGYLKLKYPELAKKVIIGKSFANIKEIIGKKDSKTELIYDSGAQDMKKAMLKADLAISSGGQTLYELARIGVPTIGVCFANNQLLNLNGLAEKGFIKFAGWYSEKVILKKINECLSSLSYEERLRMNKIGVKLVDGGGPRRVVRDILSRKPA
jgi:UDP-2,4-diacetamido-2,4,6-trideoxy-beta-L-altropyranose hydrolase